jgi:hypothetical protein
VTGKGLRKKTTRQTAKSPKARLAGQRFMDVFYTIVGQSIHVGLKISEICFGLRHKKPLVTQPRL